MSQLLEIAQGTKTNKVAMGSTTLDDEIAMETAILSDEISHETTLDVDAIETALDESEFDLTNSSSLPSPSMNKTLSTSNTNVKRTRLIDMDLGYVPRKSWTTPEKQYARDLFANCIESNVLPSLKDCKIAQQNNIHLKNRSPQQLRLWIHNEINKKKRPNAAKGWTDTEKKIINEVFQEYIKPGCSNYPSTTEIMEVISTYKEIQHRTPTIIKSRIQYLKKLALRDLNLI